MSSAKAALFKTSFGWCAVAVGLGKVVQVVLPCSTRTETLRELKRSLTSRPFVLQLSAGDPLLKKAVRELRDYFHRAARTNELPLDLSRGTPFQCAVWRATQRIPRGRVLTYRGIASAIGRPRAARAVGNALAANPFPVFVPCHRVVGADGAPGGFQGAHDSHLKLKMLGLEGLTRESIRWAARRK